MADLQGNGSPDVITLDALGDILVRPILGQDPASIGYGAPQILNQNLPSRSIAIIPAFPTPLIASLAAGGNEVDLFGYRSGRLEVVDTLMTPPGSDQMFYVPLSVHGESELLVSNSESGQMTLLGYDSLGGPGTTVLLPNDPGLSDLVANPNGALYPMLVASNEVTGQIQVFTTEDDTLSDPRGLAAGTGLYDFSSSNSNSANPLSSLEKTTGLAVGQFDADGPPGLVTISSGSNHFDLLDGLGAGTYGNPTAFDTAGTPLVIRAADFNGDGLSDVGILESDQVQIFQNDRKGGFDETCGGVPDIPIGFDPTGFSVADLVRTVFPT